MKVLFIQNNLCARGWKEANVLNNAGIEISLLELANPSSSKDYSIFKEHIQVQVKADIGNMIKGRKTIIKEIKKAAQKGNYDLIHTHNEPDNLGIWALKCQNIPLIHDIHDLVSLKPIPWARGPKKWIVRRMRNRWERNICKMADGILCPSASMEEFIREKYAPKNIGHVENKLVKVEFIPRPKIDDGDIHFVYPGGISMKPGGTRYLWPMFKKICEQGFHVHLYPPIFNEEMQEPVRKKCHEIRGLHFHSPIPQHRVIAEISRYHFGLVLFSSYTENIRMATSNRIYEYQVAGLPVISNDSGNIADYIKKKRCGEVISRPEDIKKIIKKKRKYNLDTSDCYMDSKSILKLYNMVLDR